MSVRISFSKLARREGVAPSTVWRWHQKGVRGYRLPASCMGGRRYTTQEDFQDWCHAITVAKCGAEPVRTPAARTRAVKAANGTLKEMGVAR